MTNPQQVQLSADERHAILELIEESKKSGKQLSTLEAISQYRKSGKGTLTPSEPTTPVDVSEEEKPVTVEEKKPKSFAETLSPNAQQFLSGNLDENSGANLSGINWYDGKRENTVEPLDIPIDENQDQLFRSQNGQMPNDANQNSNQDFNIQRRMDDAQKVRDTLYQSKKVDIKNGTARHFLKDDLKQQSEVEGFEYEFTSPHIYLSKEGISVDKLTDELQKEVPEYANNLLQDNDVQKKIFDLYGHGLSEKQLELENERYELERVPANQRNSEEYIQKVKDWEEKNKTLQEDIVKAYAQNIDKLGLYKDKIQDFIYNKYANAGLVKPIPDNLPLDLKSTLKSIEYINSDSEGKGLLLYHFYKTHPEDVKGQSLEYFLHSLDYTRTPSVDAVIAKEIAKEQLDKHSDKLPVQAKDAYERILATSYEGEGSGSLTSQLHVLIQDFVPFISAIESSVNDSRYKGIVEKVQEEGISSLTPSEKAIYEAIGTLNKWQDVSTSSFTESATTNFLPSTIAFAGELAMTSGLGKLIKGAVVGGKEFEAYKAITNTYKDILVNSGFKGNLQLWSTKAIDAYGATLGLLVKTAAARTPETIDYIIKKTTPQQDYYFSSEANKYINDIYSVTNKDMTSLALESYLLQVVEVGTEQLGEPYIQNFTKWLLGGVDKIAPEVVGTVAKSLGVSESVLNKLRKVTSVSQVSDYFSRNILSKLAERYSFLKPENFAFDQVRKLFKSAEFSGMLPEIGEEIMGGVLAPIITGDYSDYDKFLTDPAGTTYESIVQNGLALSPMYILGFGGAVMGSGLRGIDKTFKITDVSKFSSIYNSITNTTSEEFLNNKPKIEEKLQTIKDSKTQLAALNFLTKREEWEDGKVGSKSSGQSFGEYIDEQKREQVKYDSIVSQLKSGNNVDTNSVLDQIREIKDTEKQDNLHDLIKMYNDFQNGDNHGFASFGSYLAKQQTELDDVISPVISNPNFITIEQAKTKLEESNLPESIKVQATNLIADYEKRIAAKSASFVIPQANKVKDGSVSILGEDEQPVIHADFDSITKKYDLRLDKSIKEQATLDELESRFIKKYGDNFEAELSDDESSEYLNVKEKVLSKLESVLLEKINFVNVPMLQMVHNIVNNTNTVYTPLQRSINARIGSSMLTALGAYNLSTTKDRQAFINAVHNIAINIGVQGDNAKEAQATFAENIKDKIKAAIKARGAKPESISAFLNTLSQYQNLIGAEHLSSIAETVDQAWEAKGVEIPETVALYRATILSEENETAEQIAKQIDASENAKAANERVSEVFSEAKKRIYFNGLKELLESNFKGLTITISEEEFAKPGYEDKAAFVRNKSEVVLNPTKFRLHSPLHEVGHIWAAITKKNNIKLYEQGIELAKTDELFKHAQRLYPTLSEDGQAEETLVELIARKGAYIYEEKIKKESTIYGKIQNWLSNLWDFIAEKLNFGKNGVEVENMILSDYIEWAAKDILTKQFEANVDLGDEKSMIVAFAKQDIKYLKTAFDNNTPGEEIFGKYGIYQDFDGLKRYIPNVGKVDVNKIKTATSTGRPIPKQMIVEWIIASRFEETHEYRWDEYKVKDVLDFEELFSRYPETADTVIRPYTSNNLQEAGFVQYDPLTAKSTIYVNINTSDGSTTDTIFHELQHIVQKIEGWESGWNPDAHDHYLGMLQHTIEMIQNNSVFTSQHKLRLIDKLNYLATSESMESYSYNYGEIEAVYNHVSLAEDGTASYPMRYRLQRMDNTLQDYMMQEFHKELFEVLPRAIETYKSENGENSDYFNMPLEDVVKLTSKEFQKFYNKGQFKLIKIAPIEYAELNTDGKFWTIKQIKSYASGAPLFQVDAFHGSPYEFDKFDTNKIGTGEGNQAFGWGLYFSDVKSVAEHYARFLAVQPIKKLTFAGHTIKKDYGFDDEYEDRGSGGFTLTTKDGEKRQIVAEEGEPQDYYWFWRPNDEPTEEAKLVTYFSTISKSINRAIHNGEIEITKDTILGHLFLQRKDALELKNEEEARAIKETIGFIEDNKNSEFKVNYEPRKLYSVTIHEGRQPSEYNWLEWDKDVEKSKLHQLLRKLEEYGKELYKNKEISEKAFLSIAKGIKFPISFSSKEEINFHGAELYGTIRRILEEAFLIDNSEKGYEESAKKASMFLLSNGIDGIRYPTREVNGKSEGFNYVVFDPNAVSIKKIEKFQSDDFAAASSSADDFRNYVNKKSTPEVGVMDARQLVSKLYNQLLSEGHKKNYINSYIRDIVEIWKDAFIANNAVGNSLFTDTELRTAIKQKERNSLDEYLKDITNLATILGKVTDRKYESQFAKMLSIHKKDVYDPALFRTEIINRITYLQTFDRPKAFISEQIRGIVKTWAEHYVRNSAKKINILKSKELKFITNIPLRKDATMYLSDIDFVVGFVENSDFRRAILAAQNARREAIIRASKFMTKDIEYYSFLNRLARVNLKIFNSAEEVDKYTGLLRKRLYGSMKDITGATNILRFKEQVIQYEDKSALLHVPITSNSVDEDELEGKRTLAANFAKVWRQAIHTKSIVEDNPVVAEFMQLDVDSMSMRDVKKYIQYVSYIYRNMENGGGIIVNKDIDDFVRTKLAQEITKRIEENYDEKYSQFLNKKTARVFMKDFFAKNGAISLYSMRQLANLLDGNKNDYSGIFTNELIKPFDRNEAKLRNILSRINADMLPSKYKLEEPQMHLIGIVGILSQKPPIKVTKGIIDYLDSIGIDTSNIFERQLIYTGDAYEALAKVIREDLADSILVSFGEMPEYFKEDYNEDALKEQIQNAVIGEGFGKKVFNEKVNTVTKLIKKRYGKDADIRGFIKDVIESIETADNTPGILNDNEIEWLNKAKEHFRKISAGKYTDGKTLEYTSTVESGERYVDILNYFPVIRYSTIAKIKDSFVEDKDDEVQLQNTTVATASSPTRLFTNVYQELGVRHDFTTTRKKVIQSLKTNAMDVFQSRADQEIFYILNESGLKTMQRILTSNFFRNNFTSKSRNLMANLYKYYFARGMTEAKLRLKHGEAFGFSGKQLQNKLNNFRSLFLGAFTSAPAQLASVFNGVQTMHGINPIKRARNVQWAIGKFLSDYYSNDHTLSDFIKNNMTEIETRGLSDWDINFDSTDAYMSYLFNVVKNGKYKNSDNIAKRISKYVDVKNASKAQLSVLVALDRMSAKITALANYKYYVEKNGGRVDFANPDRAAIDFAINAVRETQASESPLSKPGVLVGVGNKGEMRTSPTLELLAQSFWAFKSFAVTDHVRVRKAWSNVIEGAVEGDSAKISDASQELVYNYASKIAFHYIKILTAMPLYMVAAAMAGGDPWDTVKRKTDVLNNLIQALFEFVNIVEPIAAGIQAISVTTEELLKGRMLDLKEQEKYQEKFKVIGVGEEIALDYAHKASEVFAATLTGDKERFFPNSIDFIMMTALMNGVLIPGTSDLMKITAEMEREAAQKRRKKGSGFGYNQSSSSY